MKYTVQVLQILMLSGSGIMSCIKKLLFSALLAPLLSGQGTRAAEFEVLDRFSVDGYTVLKSSADIPGGSLTVGGSAFVVKSGSVGIGTTAPAAALDVKGAINVLNPGVGVSVGSLNTNTGILGVTFGYGNSVDAANGVAMGKSNTASGGNNAAIGFSNSAGTGFASAFGYNNNAGAWNSNAFGYSNTASSSGASAFGNNVNNSIANSLMIGPSNTAKITILSTGLVGIGTTVPRGRIESLASNNSSTYDSAAYTGGGMGNPG